MWLPGMCGMGPKASKIMIALILLASCVAAVALGEAIYSPNVTMQELVESFVPLFMSSAGGTVYAGANGSVCVGDQTYDSYVPLTLSLMGQLYSTVGGGTLDPVHGCYISNASADGTRSCVARISSTSAECGDKATESLDVAASSVERKDMFGMPGSGGEALVASIKLAYGTEQLELAKSLLRTREIENLLDTEYLLLTRSSAVVKGRRELEKRLTDIISRMSELDRTSYDIVMAKYWVLQKWLKRVFGNTGFVLEHGGLPDSSSVSCPLSQVFELLPQLLDLEGVVTGVRLALSDLFEIVDSRRKDLDKVRTLLCLQGIYVVGALLIDDARYLKLHQAFKKETLSLNSTWSLIAVRGILTTSKIEAQRDLGGLLESAVDRLTAKVFGRNETERAECLKRAVLQAPYPSTGKLPLSIVSCIDLTVKPVVPKGRGLPYVSEPAPATKCPGGYGIWSGSCGGAFDVARCELCPSGAVFSTDGYCTCANSDAYLTASAGCVLKAGSSEPPRIKWESSEGSVVVVPSEGDGTQARPLFKVSLPETVLREDKSAYLSVNAVCELGVTTLAMSPSGNRSAPCGEDIAYQRRIERTGTMFVGAGREGGVVGETYAKSLTVSVVQTGGVFGDRCNFTASVGSVLRTGSASQAVGSVTLLMQVAPLKLRASSLRASGVRKCEDVALKPPEGEGAVLGVCKTDRGTGAIYLDTRGYRFLPRSGVEAWLKHVSLHADASRLQKVVRELRKRVGLRMSVLGVDNEVLVEVKWKPSGNETVGVVSQPFLILRADAGVLEAVRRVRVEAVDLHDGTALAPRLETVDYAVSKAELSGLNADGKENAKSNLSKIAFFVLFALVVSQIVLLIFQCYRIQRLKKAAEMNEGHTVQ